jgi:TRAP-type C4-dicarboxylate transport system substrate-binding protein
LVWNKLNDQEKQWLQEAADESVEIQRQLWAESEIESLLMMVQEAGVANQLSRQSTFYRTCSANF